MAQSNHIPAPFTPSLPLVSWPLIWNRLARVGATATRQLPPELDDEEEVSGVHRLATPPSPGPRRTPQDVLYPLTPEARSFREQVKTLLAGPEFAPCEGLTATQQAQVSYARFQLVRRELDLRIRDVRERPERLAAALELVNAIDGTLFTVMSIHYCLCAGSLLRHGAGSSSVEEVLDELDDVRSIGTFLVTELGYGNNVVSLETRADYDPRTQEVIVTTPRPEARKFMPNTGLPGVPKVAVVMARLFAKGEDCGVFPVLMRLRTEQGTCPGVSIARLGDKPAYALDNAITSFHGVRVPRDCLLLGQHATLTAGGDFSSSMKSRRQRFLLSMEQVQLGRLCLSGVCATSMAAGAFIAIRYAQQRKTFAPRHADVPVLDYRNHQRDVFSALAYAYGARLMVNAAVARNARATDAEHDLVFRITSATKAHTSYAADHYLRLCRERCGAAGLFEENRVAVYAAHCQGVITAEGDNQIVLIKIARQMLLRQGYEPLPRPKRRRGASLGDPQRLMALLRSRERELLATLRLRMAPASLLPGRLFDTWNDNVNLALEVARAHASRLAVEAFYDGLDEAQTDRSVVDLFRLFALRELEPHLGYFLAEGLVSRAEVKGFGQIVDRLCVALRPEALRLAEALDVPNELLRSPLASPDYVAAYDARARRQDLADGFSPVGEQDSTGADSGLPLSALA